MGKDVITRAKEFAKKAHESIDHRRMYTNEPYIKNPESVAEIVASVTSDPSMIAAAWLHDTVEDTPVTKQDIWENFGEDIFRLVDDLTDVSVPEDGNRKTRKAIDRDHTAKACPRAKTIKLADIIHNTASVAHHDPTFAKVYIPEKRKQLEVLEEGDMNLLTRAKQQIKSLLTKLEEEGQSPSP